MREEEPGTNDSSFSEQGRTFCNFVLVPQFRCDVGYLLSQEIHKFTLHTSQVSSNKEEWSTQLFPRQLDTAKTQELMCRFGVDRITEMGSQWAVVDGVVEMGLGWQVTEVGSQWGKSS